MEKKLLTYNTVLAVLSMCVPLVLFPHAFIFPFIVPKILFFRSITLLLVLGYLLLLFHKPSRYRLVASPTLIAIWAFFASFAISTFIGIDWYKSFWDNHERMLGLFTVFHYALYATVLSAIFSGKEVWRRLLYSFLGAGSIVMLLGLWQFFIDRQALLNMGSVRVSSTLGNAIYFSGYGLFLFYIGAYLAITEHTSRALRYAASVGSIVGLIGIFAGGTRGTLVGLLVSAFVASIGYVLLLRGHKKARRVLGALLVGTVIFGALLIGFRKTPFVRSIPNIGRLVNTSLSAETAQTRIMAWGIAVESWKDYPVFGVGPNNFFYEFNRLYKPEFLEEGYGETWFDNAHSSVFNTLAVQGLVGLLLYIALFVVPIIVLYKAYRAKHVDVHAVVLLSAFLVGHFMHNAFVFENPTSYLYFFFILAYIDALTKQKLPVVEESRRLGAGLVIGACVVVFLFILVTNINPGRANVAAVAGLREVALRGDNDPLKRALTIPTPHIDDLRMDVARIIGQTIPKLIDAGQPQLAAELFRYAYIEAEKNFAIHPLDIRLNVQLTQLAQMGAILLNDPSWFARAEQLTLDALEHSPKRQQLFYNLSGARMQLGNPEGAIAALDESIALDPVIGEGWWRKMYIYGAIGEPEMARETYLQALDAGARIPEAELQAIENFGVDLSGIVAPE